MGRDANIEVVARIRPSKKSSGNLTLSREEGWVEVYAPREDYQGEVNNRKERHTFGFSRVLDPQITQEEVFDSVAKPVCDSALEGFNATIFAYGQTGSGKTFTITGGAERYVDRGIIPRSISHIFSQVSKRSAELVISVQISYLEIYNESAYDLLDPSHDTKSLEDLPKVSMLEDENGVLHTRNLGVHPARSEEDALNLLFIGDTNRMIAETPMNMASSRSHCIFTMIIETRKAGSDTIRRSKLNFVDLAGSERVKKTGVEGTLLRDARYINISLHFLEQVIVALHERSSGKARNHIPYRNSMMTMVLRDSLGGNCKTTMIATMAAEDSSLPETVSTCRFAQRVAQISNRLEINEEVDPKLMIARLKAQVVDLKAALAEARGERGARGVEALSADERARCEEMVNAYVADVSADAALEPADMAQVALCFRLLRARALAADGGEGGARGAAPKPAPTARASSALAEGAGALELQLQQRDHEIAILVSMLKKKQGGAAATQQGSEAWTQTAAGGAEGAGVGLGIAVPALRVADAHAAAAAYGAPYGGGDAHARAAPATPNAYAPLAAAPRPQPATPGGTPLARQPTAEAAQIEAIRAAGLDPAALLQDRNAAFELFRKSYRKNQVIEENKALLKDKYDEAKALGAAVNSSRARINKLKSHIEQIRVERAMQGLSTDAGAPTAADPEEESCKASIEGEKEAYKAAFNRLKELKVEIEHLQLLLEQSRKRLQKDFDGWFLLLERQGAAAQPAYAHAAHQPPTGYAPAQQHASRGGERPAPASGGPQLTGNPEVDAEILAFYKARESLLQAQQRP